MKYIVSLNGKNYEVNVTESEAVLCGVSTTDVPAEHIENEPLKQSAETAAVSGVKVVSPMPGNVLSINIRSGQAVKKGEILMVLEAMKMENDIVAPADGVVKQVLVSKGATVNTDDILAVI